MWFKDKNIVITGGNGFLGYELCKFLFKDSQNQPKKIIIIDKNEKVNFLSNNYNTIFGDISCKDWLYEIMPDNINYIIHFAVEQYFNITEKQPNLTVETNIIGLKNILDIMQEKGIKNILFPSSGKACNPTSVYGMTKYLCERILLELGKKGVINPYIVRFGNILGGQGSVIRIWGKLIKEGKDITLFGDNIKRFIYTKNQAIDLVNYVFEKKLHNKIIIPELRVGYMKDIAELMIEGTKSKIQYGDRGIIENDKEEIITKYEGNFIEFMGETFIGQEVWHVDFNKSCYPELPIDGITTNNCQELTKDELRGILKNEGFI